CWSVDIRLYPVDLRKIWCGRVGDQVRLIGEHSPIIGQKSILDAGETGGIVRRIGDPQLLEEQRPVAGAENADQRLEPVWVGRESDRRITLIDSFQCWNIEVEGYGAVSADCVCQRVGSHRDIGKACRASRFVRRGDDAGEIQACRMGYQRAEST